MSSGFFRGTNTEQDSRWGDAEKKLLRRTKFSKVLEQKVNMKKVNMNVMQRWITQRITSLLGFEDDIVVGTCINYLSEEGKLDPKKLQLQLTGFLEKSTGMFMEELWGLLVDAQNSLGGIPSAFLQDKKEEMLVVQEEQRKQEEELRQRMAEHQQEMERAATSMQANSTEADTTSSTGALEAAPRRKPSDGRRASRWGISPANPSTSQAAGSVISADVAIAKPPAAESLGSIDISVVEPSEGSNRAMCEQGTDTGSMEDCEAEKALDDDVSRNRTPLRRSPSPVNARKRSPIRNVSEDGASPERSNDDSRKRGDDRCEDRSREKKRKFKSKHQKKSDRKKNKRKSGEEREHRRSSRKGESAGSAINSGGEGSSGEENEDNQGDTSAIDVEEALRMKLVASVALKKGQQNQA